MSKKSGVLTQMAPHTGMRRTAFANIVKRTKAQTDEQALRSSTLKTLDKKEGGHYEEHGQ